MHEFGGEVIDLPARSVDNYHLTMSHRHIRDADSNLPLQFGPRV
jgi:hypothetical protein